MPRITKVEDLKEGDVYQLSGGIFCAVVLDTNKSGFNYVGLDKEDSNTLVFVGVDNGQPQYFPESLLDDPDTEYGMVSKA